MAPGTVAPTGRRGRIRPCTAQSRWFLCSRSPPSPREMARQLLQLIVQTWGRTLNHKPRKDRQGRSRAEIYTTETPTPEQVEQAHVEARLKQQELARETQQARQDPVVRALLDDAFARLGRADPEGNVRAAIARYPLDHVVGGIATFEGKHHAGTLPWPGLMLPAALRAPGREAPVLRGWQPCRCLL